MSNGDVEEADHDKQSIYALLYSLYRSVGNVQSDRCFWYEMPFNTWGYACPASWGAAITADEEPRQFGMNAYRGLYHFQHVKNYISR